MHTYIANLSKSQHEQLALLIQRIVGAIQPEKIICYGCRVITSLDWSCFLDSEPYGECSKLAFDLLLITADDEKRAFHEIIQIAEQQCDPHITISSVTHKLTAVNEAIQAGSYFFSSLLHKGVLLYDNSCIPLLPVQHEEAYHFPISKAEAIWGRWYDMAKRFYLLALHSLSCEWPDQSVFLLHQAVEHTCIALIRVFTGYRSNTHNLARLLAMTENFSPIPTGIFPRLTPEETTLFNHLLNGYADPRYKDGYCITTETILILIRRVEQLQDAAEKLYLERVSQYRKNAGISFTITNSYLPTP